MLKTLRTKNGQTTLEYAILITVVIAALLTIQNYMKRGFQGRMKSASDDIGAQFSPGNTDQKVRTTRNSKSQDTFLNGTSKSKLQEDDFTNREEETVVHGDEFWGTNAVPIGDSNPDVSIADLVGSVPPPEDR